MQTSNKSQSRISRTRGRRVLLSAEIATDVRRSIEAAEPSPDAQHFNHEMLSFDPATGSDVEVAKHLDFLAIHHPHEVANMLRAVAQARGLTRTYQLLLDELMKQE